MGTDKEITGGEIVVETLKKLDLDVAFGTTGAGMPDLQDAMSYSKYPQWVQGLHEFPTVAAAMGHSLASGKVSLALIDRVVGTQNALGAIYGAFTNMAPILILSSKNEPGIPIVTGETQIHYSTMHHELARTWCKWLASNESMKTADYDLFKAYQMAATEPKGPVFVTFRQDLMAQGYQKREFVQRLRKPGHTPKRIPDRETIERITQRLIEAKKPYLILGHTGRNATSVGAFVKLANKLGIGVLERRFFLNYPMSDPMHQGFVDRNKLPEVPVGVDLLLLVELGLTPNQAFSEDISVIDLESDPLFKQDVSQGGDYGSSYLNTEISAICDASETVSEICRIADEILGEPDSSRISERKKGLSGSHRKLFSSLEEKSKSHFATGKLDIESIGHVLGLNLDANTIWVNGTSALQAKLVQYVSMDTPGSYFTNPSGHLGSGPGMAYGAAVYAKSAGKRVVCTLGDGDAIFGNLDSCLWTASHYELPVTYVVLNNGSWGIEWPFFQRTLKRYAAENNDYSFTDLDNPRISFTKIADAMEVENMRVETSTDFNSSLRKALSSSKGNTPALIELWMPKYPASP